ncbi:universal stress protein [Flavivirga eckloniae]|uniref:Universal stress protein n=1 Tax=Flavivirga eckloniae TaxID=1803846 RepID=A0A2K9PW87_9FLAO|nr:universal stress protein [Flavivirga eckloniae]AUP81331.1 universal stress protein [Flavivirga eckloniae]
MKNILLPTDFSENSWNAIRYALNFFENTTCDFYLLHVTRSNNLETGEMPYGLTPELTDTHYLKPAKKQLRQLLKQIAKQFSPRKNHRFYTLTDYNFFIDSIRKHIENKKIDMIVMGTKGASGLKEYIVGSNTGDVIKKVPCTTLVVPENTLYAAIKEVAFPTDFSLSYNINTLQPISEIVEETGAFLRIVHINRNGDDLNDDQQEYKGIIEDFFNDYSHSFHFLNNKKVEDAIQCFVESRDINMIVMVAKNLNYFQQILFHTRVEKISYHTDIPFLVLHE